ncbi:MAG: arsenate reductase (glutaredoxin) [Rhizobiales bacterium]|nr:arsenate reductase (glutaredoxin) [Hyphomicrobiales bacterium]
MTTTLYHNPRCTKSRAALQHLEEKNIKFNLVTYLDAGLTEVEIVEILSLLNMPAKDMIRKEEAVFKELGLSLEDTEATLVAAIAQNPILFERPVLVKDNKAVIGRPAEKLVEFVSANF